MSDERFMYQIFLSNDGTLEAGPSFRLLTDAIRYVQSHSGERSFAIRDPDGSWYRDSAGRAIFGRRSMRTEPELAQGSARLEVELSPTDPTEVTSVTHKKPDGD